MDRDSTSERCETFRSRRDRGTGATGHYDPTALTAAGADHVVDTLEKSGRPR
jgi:hypothetical protein